MTETFFTCPMPHPQNKFTVRIVGDLNGLPDNDNLIFEARQQQTPSIFHAEELGIVIGDRILFRYTLDLNPPLQMTTLDPMYLLIANDTTGPTGPSCYWLWRTAPPGDNQSWVDDFTGWDATDLNEFDLAYCFDFQTSGQTRFPPRVTFEVAGPVDIATGCCKFRYNVRNRNAPLPNHQLNEFFVEINRGTAPNICNSLSSITAPLGWNVAQCEPWTNGRGVFRFFGGTLAPQATTFGHILTSVNGFSPVTVMVRNSETGQVEAQEIPPFGLRGWGSQSNGAALCGTGTFGPHPGQQGDWSTGNDGVCALQPIPSLATTGKVALASLLTFIGAALVLRSKTPAAA